jgi:hypothetical protein
VSQRYADNEACCFDTSGPCSVNDFDNSRCHAGCTADVCTDCCRQYITAPAPAPAAPAGSVPFTDGFPSGIQDGFYKIAGDNDAFKKVVVEGAPDTYQVNGEVALETGDCEPGVDPQIDMAVSFRDAATRRRRLGTSVSAKDNTVSMCFSKKTKKVKKPFKLESSICTTVSEDGTVTIKKTDAAGTPL